MSWAEFLSGSRSPPSGNTAHFLARFLPALQAPPSPRGTFVPQATSRLRPPAPAQVPRQQRDPSASGDRVCSDSPPLPPRRRPHRVQAGLLDRHQVRRTLGETRWQVRRLLPSQAWLWIGATKDSRGPSGESPAAAGSLPGCICQKKAALDLGEAFLPCRSREAVGERPRGAVHSPSLEGFKERLGRAGLMPVLCGGGCAGRPPLLLNGSSSSQP